jgi:hypothetical protein
MGVSHTPNAPKPKGAVLKKRQPLFGMSGMLHCSQGASPCLRLVGGKQKRMARVLRVTANLKEAISKFAVLTHRNLI